MIWQTNYKKEQIFKNIQRPCDKAYYIFIIAFSFKHKNHYFLLSIKCTERNEIKSIFNHIIRSSSRSTAKQYERERTFLKKEEMYLLKTPSVILPYF